MVEKCFEKKKSHVAVRGTLLTVVRYRRLARRLGERVGRDVGVVSKRTVGLEGGGEFGKTGRSDGRCWSG